MIDNPKVKVSVILPVYNVEDYIGRCIESLQAQTLDGLEFIFVDDCSTDGSMKAVEAWAAEDESVRILRNDENIGAGPSRNHGIDVARGEYLSFVDPDDYVAKDFYELLYAAATKDGRHDIAKGVRKKVDETGTLIQEYKPSLNKRIQACLLSDKPLYVAFTYEHQTALYNRKLFSDPGVRYGMSYNSQDTTFLLRYCYQTNDIILEKSAVYFYVQREGSAVHNAGMSRINGELSAFAEKAAFFKDKHLGAFSQNYVKLTIINIITSFYSLSVKDPTLADAISEYSVNLKRIVDESPALRFLQNDSLEYRALVEKSVLLPNIHALPEKEKLKGALSWINYVHKNRVREIGYIVKCAKVVMRAFLQLTTIKGKRLLKKC